MRKERRSRETGPRTLLLCARMPPEHRPRPLASGLAKLGLRALRGWRFEGDLPTERRAVILACPHTSNVDGLLLVLLAQSVGLDVRWMVKDSWAKPPVGWITEAVGALPIDRSRPNGMVGQMIEAFDQRDDLMLLIPPEGTRSYAPHWRSGFYHIALGAEVPVIPGYLDYARRRAGFGDAVHLTGNRRADMDGFREFYQGGRKMARFPAHFGPVRLDNEDAP